MVRVVIETRTLGSREASVAGLGGRVERTSGNLAGGARPEQADRALAAIDRRSRPYPFMRFDHALSGEETAAMLAAASCTRRIHRKGRQGRHHRRRLRGPRRASGRGRAAGERRHAGLLRGELATASEHGTAVAEIVHEMAPDAQLYLPLRRHRGRSRCGGGVREEPGRPRDQPLRGLEAVPQRRAVRSARSSRTLGRAESSGSTLPGTRGRPTGRAPTARTATSTPGTRTVTSATRSSWAGRIRVPEVGRVARRVSDFDLGLFLSGPNTSSRAPRRAGRRRAAVRGVVRRAEHRLRPRGVLGDSGIQRLDVAAARSRELEPAARVPGRGRQTRCSGVLAGGTWSARCAGSRTLEPYSSQGPTIDGRMKPDIVGHDSVSSMTYGPFYRPSACSRNLGVSPEVAAPPRSSSRRIRSSSGSGQAVPHAQREDLGAPGLDSVHGAGELQLPKPPDVVAPTATARGAVARARLSSCLRPCRTTPARSA